MTNSHTNTPPQKFLWELVSIENDRESFIIKKNQILIGRTESCDFIIKDSFISSVHASITLNPDYSIVLTDLGSKNGTFVNEQLINSKALINGDEIKLGKKVYALKQILKDNTEILFVPDINDAATGIIELENLGAQSQSSSKSKPNYKDITKPSIFINKQNDIQDQQVALPLTDIFPQHEYSQYIFEDAKHLYPIFQYKKDQESIEIITINDDRVLSIDYLSTDYEQTYLTGRPTKDNFLNLPLLKNENELPFTQVKERQITVNTLENFTCLNIESNNTSTKLEKNPNITKKNIILHSNNIIFFEKDNLKLIVRKVPAPPQIKPPPFFGRDRRLLFIIIPFLILALGLMTFLYTIKVKKEVLEERLPEQIVKIMVKPKVIIKKEEPSPAPTTAVLAEKTAGGSEGLTKQIEKSKEVAAPKEITEAKVTNPKPPRKPATPAPKVTTPTKNKATEIPKIEKPTPQSFDFSKKASKVLNQASGNSENIGAITYSQSQFTNGTGLNNSAAYGSNAVGKLNLAGRSKGGTSLGLGKGTSLGEGGAQGIGSGKQGTDLSEIAYKTVVLGIIDPKVVRELLYQHMSELSYCYDEEIYREKVKNVGNIMLDFTITASGRASNINFSSKQWDISPKGLNCISGVLKSIQFPQPKGGGTVKIRQPMNFK